MANDALFIDISTVLWAANISAPKDETGKPIVPNTTDGKIGITMCVLLKFARYVTSRYTPPFAQAPFTVRLCDYPPFLRRPIRDRPDAGAAGIGEYEPGWQ